MIRSALLLPALLLTLLAACSADQGADVPPLPKQNAETARRLMVDAEGAAAEAGKRMEQAAPATRSTATTNEVTK